MLRVILGGLLAVLTLGFPGTGSQALAHDGTTWYVDDDGLDCPHADFSKIRDAVSACEAGDTIIVCPGYYAELDPIIKAWTVMVIEEGAVWRIRKLMIYEGALLVVRGQLYFKERISHEGMSRIRVEGGGRITSAPHDLFLIIDEAQTDNGTYSMHESVAISALVLDMNGTPASAYMTAEISKPDGTTRTVSLDETGIGGYEGVFTDTSTGGDYRVSIRAERTGYIGHTVWLAFEAGKSVTVCTETATGTGEVCFTTSDGFIEDLQALPVPPNPPDGYTFPHGLFSFKVTDLDYDGQTVTVTVDLPDPVPAGTKWWKYHDGQWHDYDIPITIDGNTITITLTDGGIGDIDGAADGIITDPGGPGNPVPSLTVGWEGSPVNKAAVMAPWIALLAVMAGVSLLVLRRRQAQI